MARYVVIASRNYSDLYGHLQRQFVGDDEVQVLLDRRHDERRRRKDTREVDRRRAERRVGHGKDLGLHYHGFLIVRQAPQGIGTRIQWRPPWWESDKPGEPAGLEKPQWPGEAHAIETRKRVTGWIMEGQRLLSLVSKQLAERGRTTARAETAERKCERLEEEMKSLRTENEHFKKELKQLAETLMTLAGQLVEPAMEAS